MLNYTKGRKSNVFQDLTLRSCVRQSEYRIVGLAENGKAVKLCANMLLGTILLTHSSQHRVQKMCCEQRWRSLHFAETKKA